MNREELGYLLDGMREIRDVLHEILALEHEGLEESRRQWAQHWELQLKSLDNLKATA